jgi:hypothetical protein
LKPEPEDLLQVSDAKKLQSSQQRGVSRVTVNKVANIAEYTGPELANVGYD